MLSCQARCGDLPSFGEYAMLVYRTAIHSLKGSSEKTLFSKSFETDEISESYINRTTERIQKCDKAPDSIMLLPPLFGHTKNEGLIQAGHDIILVIDKGVVIPVLCNPTATNLQAELGTLVALYEGTYR